MRQVSHTTCSLLPVTYFLKPCNIREKYNMYISARKQAAFLGTGGKDGLKADAEEIMKMQSTRPRLGLENRMHRW